MKKIKKLQVHCTGQNLRDSLEQDVKDKMYLSYISFILQSQQWAETSFTLLIIRLFKVWH